MFLSQIFVQSFRGLRHLKLDLDATTVLIGENATGKTSLIDALDICLGVDANGDGFAFESRDFHVPREAREHDAPPPIEIALSFREEKTGEWDEPSLAPLAPAMLDGRRERRRLRLRVLSRQSEDGVRSEATFLDSDGRPLAKVDIADALATLRRVSPLILVSADRAFRRQASAPPSATPLEASTPESQHRRALEQRVADIYQRITTARHPLAEDDIREGLVAVGELALRLAAFAPGPERPRRLLRELVQTPMSFALGSGPRIDAERQGASAQSIGVLVLAGALLEARGGQPLAPEAHPIVAIEEPEAHLHPLTLASIWGLVGGMRGQKLVTTNSGRLLAAAPLLSVRRLALRDGETRSFRLRDGTLDIEEMRRVGYHVRVRRDDAFFARCWLLVEGETEFWLVPELARLLGTELPGEGIECVEFAQCGPAPLVKLANDLGIPWHLICDGDASGRAFANAVRPHLGGAPESDRLTVLRERDIEHCLWENGYAEVYRHEAGRGGGRARSGRSGERPWRVIERAVKARSKPYLALAAVRAAASEGSPGVPPPLRGAIETAVRLARDSSLP